MLTQLETGQPFPVHVPVREGATMELWESGLVVLIQMPGLTGQEKESFDKSFRRYSYLETKTSAPVAVWVFDFPRPHGAIDVNFNARTVRGEYIENYLDTTQGLKNLITFCLLNNKTLEGIKLVGLESRAVNLFHATIRKQLALSYARADYDLCLSAVFEYSTDQLFLMGYPFEK